MGFRSTFTLEHYNVDWPKWFREKYKTYIYFSNGLISPKREAKTYTTFKDLPSDIQKSIDWDDFYNNIILVYLHECGGITRVQIEKDRIIMSEPTKWKVVDNVTHYCCSRCDEPQKEIP